MLTDPTALARSYIPETQDVLASTPLVNPTETTEITFTAPTAPGRYPYVCTFPGHWRIMQGTLVVTP
jgi:azurin